MRVTLEVSESGSFSGTLQAVSQRLGDMRDFWEDVARRVVYPSLKANFASEGRPRRWKPLDAKYAKWKRAHFPGRRILVLRGAMKRAITGTGGSGFKRATRSGLVVGIRKGAISARAGVHNFGSFNAFGRGIRIPARPFMLLQSEDREKITSMATSFIAKGVRDAKTSTAGKRSKGKKVVAEIPAPLRRLAAQRELAGGGERGWRVLRSGRIVRR